MSIRVLIISPGDVGQRMSAPGIRAFHMAQALAQALPHARITLAAPKVDTRLQGFPEKVKPYPYGERPLLWAAQDADVVVANFLPVRLASLCAHKLVVVDLFAQYFAEWMEVTVHQEQGLTRDLVWLERRAYIAFQLAVADLVLCANERQRLSYLGALRALGLRRPVAVAPHGLRPQAPQKRRQVVKGVYPGIRPTDKLLIWNGGTTDWYDPDTFLLALHHLAQERDDIKALFLGATYPNVPALGWGRRFRSAIDTAKELGLYGSTVFFEFGWVPYDDVPDYLLEADAGVCAYSDHLETYYSFRTRFMDLLWAGVPIICTKGDTLAEMIEQEGLGLAVPPGDPIAMAHAIRSLLDDQEGQERIRKRIQQVRQRLTWEQAMTPLIDFCRIARPPARPRHGRLWGEVFPWALNYLATRALREVTQGEAPWLARAPQRVASRLARILRKGL
jgi:glycosyltransferase involved in cell wall biosynthesis